MELCELATACFSCIKPVYKLFFRRFLALAVNLRPGCPPLELQAAEAGLTLATRVGLSTGDFVAALLDGDRGARFYSRFRPAAQAWILFNAEACCKALMRAFGAARGSLNPKMMFKHAVRVMQYLMIVLKHGQGTRTRPASMQRPRCCWTQSPLCSGRLQDVQTHGRGAMSVHTLTQRQLLHGHRLKLLHAVASVLWPPTLLS